MNAFKALCRPEHVTIGTWIMSASHIVAEAVGHAGFEWAVVDMEHTPLDVMDVVHLLQALAGTKTVPVVRVPWNDAVMVKRVLDAGATTVLFPFVQDEHEALRAVAATRYPPDGVRGMAAMSRASRFGTTPNYVTTANAGMAVIVQLETADALTRIDAIAAVPGLDAIFIGPADLSASMGHVGQLMHPEVVSAMSDAVKRIKALGKPVGTLGGSVEQFKAYREMGFDFIALGSDLGHLMRGMQTAMAAVRSP